jgi:hypothetical protein
MPPGKSPVGKNKNQAQQKQTVHQQLELALAQQQRRDSQLQLQARREHQQLPLKPLLALGQKQPNRLHRLCRNSCRQWSRSSRRRCNR